MIRNLAVALVLIGGMLAADKPAPKVTEADKLAIRSAQVEVLQAQRVVDQAQQRLLQAVNDAYTHAKVTQAEYGMNDKLEFVEVTKPAPPTAVKVAPSPAPAAQPPK